ncbi:MAG: ABC transporter substrate-binding protein [Oscillospiraceae bacterium]
MRVRLLAAAAALVLLLTGCTDQAPAPTQTPDPSPSASVQPEQTDFTLPYYPGASLHPITGNSRANLVVASLVYHGLFELDNTFTPHGVLCSTSTVSEDGLTWTFTLTDAVFSDGTSVTAADAVSSLELARGSELYAGRLADVQRIEAAGEKALTVTLVRPNGALPALLDIPVIRDSGDGSMPLGTGPYAFVEDSGPLRLARQGSAPDSAPEEIALSPIEGADNLIYAFDAGEISLVVSDLTGSNALGYSSGYEEFGYPTTTMLFVGFQTKSGPCRDALVRQAVSRSFDRDTVTVSLLAGHGAATCLPFSPRSSLYSAAHERSGEYDPAAAAELLTQAGYAAGEDGRLYKGRSALSLTFIVNTDNSFKLTIAEYLAEQLAGLGVSVELKKLAWDDYLTALETGTFDLYLGEVTLTADFDLAPLLGQNGALNYGGYVNAETDALLTQLRGAEMSERPQAAAPLLDQFQADAPLAPLCFKNHSVLTQWGSLSGLEPTRQNPFYNLESLRFGAET